MEFALYKEQIHAPVRGRVVITCVGVSRFLCSCDLPRLKQHAAAGNVIDGVHEDGVLRVFLVGGFIEVQASSFRVRVLRSIASRKRA